LRKNEAAKGGIKREIVRFFCVVFSDTSDNRTVAAFNRYSYVENDPVDLTDPLDLQEGGAHVLCAFIQWSPGLGFVQRGMLRCSLLDAMRRCSGVMRQ